MHPGPRVTFFVRPDSFAEQNVARLSEVIEDQYSSTVRALGLSYAGHVSAYAYNSGAETDLGGDHAGRAYPETESFRFVAVPPADGNLFHLMSHEANHVFVINGLGRAGTYGMTEGLASALVSETFHTSGRHFLFMWTRTQRAQVLPLARVYDNDKWKDLVPQAAYNTSASFLACCSTPTARTGCGRFTARPRTSSRLASTRSMDAPSNRWRRTGCGSATRGSARAYPAPISRLLSLEAHHIV